MKSLLSFVLSLMFTVNIFGQQYLGDNKLVVQGNGKLIIESDRATFNFSVKGYGSNLREAVGKAKEKTTASVEILNKFGISKSNISTSFFHSAENPNGSAFLSSSEDFVANITTTVIVDSLDTLEELILTLSESQIESISNVNYSLTNMKEFEKKVAQNAIEDAKNKAEEIAKRFSVKLLKVIYIEESSFGRGYPNPFNPTTSIMQPEVLGGGLYSKPVKLTNTIKVVFEIGDGA